MALRKAQPGGQLSDGERAAADPLTKLFSSRNEIDTEAAGMTPNEHLTTSALQALGPVTAP
jgi:hypothetical protein